MSSESQTESYEHFDDHVPLTTSLILSQKPNSIPITPLISEINEFGGITATKTLSQQPHGDIPNSKHSNTVTFLENFYIGNQYRQKCA